MNQTDSTVANFDSSSAQMATKAHRFNMLAKVDRRLISLFHLARLADSPRLSQHLATLCIDSAWGGHSKLRI